MLALRRRRAGHYDDSVRRGDFLVREAADHLELYGRTVLIIGFGRIGRRVAARCRAFEMTVQCCDPYIPQHGHNRCRVYAGRRVLPRHYRRADYVSVHVPLNDETRHLSRSDGAGNSDETGCDSSSMRRGDPSWMAQALHEALEAGHLAGSGPRRIRRRTAATRRPTIAVIPPPLLMPHMGGSSRGAFIRMATRCAQNVLDALDGKLDSSFVFNTEALD